MELVKDIYFNTDKLVENTKVKVSYTGKFYQGNNEKVFLHYGYGKEWNNVNEIEMSKTDLGYQAELNLIGKDTLNFCFKNQNNEWDNNFGQNYIFDIEKNVNNIEKAENNGNLVFWGKTFGKKEEKNASSDIYWNSENNKQANNIANSIGENTSGIIEDINNSTPNSIDTFISNKAENIVETASNQKNPLNVTLETPIEKDCFAVIKTSYGNTNIEGVAKSGIANFNIDEPTANNNLGNIQTPVANAGQNNKASVATNIINPVSNQSQNAIALVPTGFTYWTKKIKETVCNFFDYLPKLISGNYKRNLDNNSADKK